MSEWMIYLLKVNTAIVLFYLGYYFLLRKLTFFNLNRYYLLVGVLFSLLYPLVDIAALFDQRHLPQPNLQLLRFGDIVQTAEPKNAFWDVLTIVFIVVVVFLLIRFFVRLMRLWDIHRQSEPAAYHIYPYRSILLRINPFSFWKSIYINPTLHAEQDLNEIFKHESVHTNELHTIDVLLIEIICTICWFNPAIWLMRLAIKENLEFLTDSKVLGSGVDRKTYQYSLVNMITQQHSPLMANHFNLKALKKRIQMMNKKNSSRLNLGKYVFLVPAITLSVMVFTVSKAYQPQEQPTDEIKLDGMDVAERDRLAGKAVGLAIDKSSSDEIQDSSAKKKDRVLIKVKPRSGPEPLYILDGVPMEDNLNQLNPNNIASIEVLKDASATALYGSKGKNGVVLITTKTGKNKDNDTNQSTTVSGNTKLRGNQDSIPNTATEKDLLAVKGKDGKIILNRLPTNVVYIIDGKIVKDDEVEKLDQDDIESVDVTKEGKDKGTVRITTKKNN